jgi:hypothetical protein
VNHSWFTNADIDDGASQKIFSTFPEILVWFNFGGSAINTTGFSFIFLPKFKFQQGLIIPVCANVSINRVEVEKQNKYATYARWRCGRNHPQQKRKPKG